MSMRVVFFALAAAFSLAANSAAAADIAHSPDETRQLAYDFAKCVVRYHAAKAAEAVLSDAENATLKKRYDALLDGNCLTLYTHDDSWMNFSGDLFHYALADALFSRELADSPVPDLSNAPPIEHRGLPDLPRPLPTNSSDGDKRQYEAALKVFDEAKVFRTVSIFGECVVRLDPAGAKALLLTRPTTAEEASRFEALGPALGQCLQKGETLAFGKAVLRGTIATNYYRLASAARTNPRTESKPKRYSGGPLDGIPIGVVVRPDNSTHFVGLKPSEPNASPVPTKDEPALRALMEAFQQRDVSKLNGFLAKNAGMEFCGHGFYASCSLLQSFSQLKMIEDCSFNTPYYLGNNEVRLEWLFNGELWYWSEVFLSNGKIVAVRTHPADMPPDHP
jgi:hypothetical protein